MIAPPSITAVLVKPMAVASICSLTCGMRAAKAKVCPAAPTPTPKKQKSYFPNTRVLESDISMITESLDEYGQEMPLSWHKVRKRILDCIFTENNEVIQRKLNKTEFKDWCAKAEVLPKSTAALLRFLHRTGIIYTDEKLLLQLINSMRQ